MQRLHVFFSGFVQGVGFRYTCMSLSARFAVSGWVRNRSDGRVELLCEGEKDELQHFLDAILAAMSGNVEERAIAWEMATGEFKDFAISATL